VLPARSRTGTPRLYTPPAADTVHAVVAEHGMVVAQEKSQPGSAPMC